MTGLKSVRKGDKERITREKSREKVRETVLFLSTRESYEILNSLVVQMNSYYVDNTLENWQS